MGKVHNGGFTASTGFKRTSNEPIDSDMVVEFLADLTDTSEQRAIEKPYRLMVVSVEETNKPYQWNGQDISDISNWNLIGNEKSNNISSDSEETVATSKAVKIVNDKVNQTNQDVDSLEDRVDDVENQKLDAGQFQGNADDIIATIFTNLIVKDENGIEKFRNLISQGLKFKGADFDEAGKTVVIKPIFEPNTIFLDDINGIDSSAEIGISTLPFKTLDAAINAIGSVNNEVFTIRFLNGNTYYLNEKLEDNDFIFESKFPTTLSFENSTQNRINENNSLVFDMPFGSVKMSTTVTQNFRHTTALKLNVKEFHATNYATYLFDGLFNGFEINITTAYLGTFLGIESNTTKDLKRYVNITNLVINGNSAGLVLSRVITDVNINNISGAGNYTLCLDYNNISVGDIDITGHLTLFSTFNTGTINFKNSIINATSIKISTYRMKDAILKGSISDNSNVFPSEFDNYFSGDGVVTLDNFKSKFTNTKFSSNLKLKMFSSSLIFENIPFEFNTTRNSNNIEIEMYGSNEILSDNPTVVASNSDNTRVIVINNYGTTKTNIIALGDVNYTESTNNINTLQQQIPT